MWFPSMEKIQFDNVSGNAMLFLQLLVGERPHTKGRQLSWLQEPQVKEPEL